MDDSVNQWIRFLVWPLPETATCLLCNCLVGALPYTHYGGRNMFLPKQVLLTVRYPSQHRVVRGKGGWQASTHRIDRS